MENKKIWAYFCQLGSNMWSDTTAATHLEFQQEAWDKIVPLLVDAGCNMIVMDIGEAIRFDCCPELAIEGAWSRERAKEEIARLRSMGFEVIPKLNFSTCHDEWMGIYSRMVSTPQYYRVVKDIIKECAELFDTPRFFHIGMDEEGIECQTKYSMAVIRQGDLWWHDFNFICDCVREAGCRPWIWADYIWDHEEIFLERMPKDVLLSNWYYGDFPEDYSASNRCIRAYQLLAEHGFDQIPTGSNWSMAGNLQKTAEFSRRHFNDEHLLGFLQTIWKSTVMADMHLHESGIRDLKETKELWESR